MIPQGTEAANVSEVQIGQVASDVESFIRANKLSRKDVARSLGYSAGVISEFLSGRYAGNKGQVAIDLESWLVEEEQRRSKPATTIFTWTNVAMQIKAVANYCLDERSIGMVYGPESSGIGKSTAIKAIYQEMGPRRCSLITLATVDANRTAILRRILAALGKDDGHGSNRARYQRILDTLKGRSHLLIIDQIHSLRDAKGDIPLYTLRDIHEETNVAQLWVGTADMDEYLQRRQVSKHDQSLAQIRRRIFPRINLMEAMRGADGGGEPLVSIDQVREMFSRNQMKISSAAARFLCELINLPDSGGIGTAVHLVRFANTLAERASATTIDVDLLKRAMRVGLMSETASLVLNRMELSNTPARKVG